MFEILAGHRGVCLLKYTSSLPLLVHTSRELFTSLSPDPFFLLGCWSKCTKSQAIINLVYLLEEKLPLQSGASLNPALLGPWGIS